MFYCGKKNPAESDSSMQEIDPKEPVGSKLECDISILSFSQIADTLFFNVINKGTKQCNWSIDSKPSYLSCNPQNGTLLPNSSTKVWVICNRDSLAEGVTRDRINIKSNNYVIYISTLVSVSLKPPQNDFIIMSYNILEGAGTSIESASVRSSSYNKKANALGDVIEFIKYYNPDIVGIQEAVRWNANDDSVAKYISNELHMNYLLAPGYKGGWCVLLLTKYKILEYKLFSTEFYTGAIKAKLQTDFSDTLTVYNFHLSVPAWHLDIVSFRNLKNDFNNTNRGIAMGDFNAEPSEIPFTSNWRLVAGGLPDQIWSTSDVGLSDSGEYYRESITVDVDRFNLYQISDHLPVLFKTGLY